MAAIRRAAYRARQLALALLAGVLPAELPDLSTYLSAGQLDCFRRMCRADQRHCLAVWRTLQEEGVRDEALLQAALLHDVGKAVAGLSMAHRVIHVLLEANAPRLLGLLARDDPKSWGYRFYLYQRHAQWGADLAQQVGALPFAVELIRWHDDVDAANLGPELAWRLRALRDADEAN